MSYSKVISRQHTKSFLYILIHEKKSAFFMHLQLLKIPLDKYKAPQS